MGVVVQNRLWALFPQGGMHCHGTLPFYPVTLVHGAAPKNSTDNTNATITLYFSCSCSFTVSSSW